MKFAFLSHVLPPAWSGQAVVIGRLLDGISPEKYILISSQDYNEKKFEREFIRRLPGKYYYLDPEYQLKRGTRFRIAKLFNEILRIIIRGFNIRSIIKQENCTLLLAGTGDIHDLPSAFLASRLARVSFIPYLFDDYIYQWPAKSINKLTKLFAKYIFPRSDTIIVPNEFLKHEILERYGADSHIIRNPCEEEKNSIITKSISTNQEEISIVFTGAIYQVNFGAFHNLIAALELLPQFNIKLHLYTALPAEWLESNGILGEKIIHHQHVSPIEVGRIQKQADILFIPFAFDSPVPEIIKTSAPGKFGDYLASGTPILVNAPPGSYILWYIRRHNCGVGVDQDNPFKLAVAIRNLIENRDQQAMISRNAQLRAMQDFNPRDAQQNFIDLIEQMIYLKQGT